MKFIHMHVVIIVYQQKQYSMQFIHVVVNWTNKLLTELVSFQTLKKRFNHIDYLSLKASG
jgi:hypothetical protein